MPSSPPEATLTAIEEHYERALAAAADGDLEELGRQLDRIDPLLAQLGDVPESGADRTFDLKPARAALERLVTVLGEDRQQTMGLLRHTRRGQKALGVYGQRLAATGTRVERDA